MGIASLIIFFNTALNYLKEESTKEDSKLKICDYFSFGIILGVYSVRRVRGVDADAYN